MKRLFRFPALATLALVACERVDQGAPSRAPAASFSSTCPDPPKYTPIVAFSGAIPPLPPAPALPPFPTKVGDAWSVYGATHHLRSRFHRSEVEGKKITIVGWVVRTNFDDAPACAIHKTGRGDPAGCVAPVPSFAIADDKTSAAPRIDVMGWASNFAQIVSMLDAIAKAPRDKKPFVHLADEFWGGDLPNPIPDVGAKVKVTGTYAVTFTKATSGAAANPRYGILTADRIEVLEPAPGTTALGKRKP